MFKDDLGLESDGRLARCPLPKRGETAKRCLGLALSTPSISAATVACVKVRASTPLLAPATDAVGRRSGEPNEMTTTTAAVCVHPYFVDMEPRALQSRLELSVRPIRPHGQNAVRPQRETSPL